VVNHPNRSGKFELCFAGSAMVRFPRYRRRHATYEAAEEAAREVLASLDNRAAHPAIIYGPGCGPDGRTVA
jgi:hypothetical protein